MDSRARAPSPPGSCVTRKFLRFALFTAWLFPAALAAEPLTVCIFQTAPATPSQPSSNPDQSDAASLAPMLSVAAGPNALTAIPVADIASKNMDAEAAKRGCAWIVELQREQKQGVSLPFDRTLSGGASAGPVFRSSGSKDASHIEFLLRKPGSRKTIAHGSTNRPDWAALFPAQILAKLAADR